MPTEAQSTSSEELAGQRVVVSLEQGLAEVSRKWGGRDGAGAGN